MQRNAFEILLTIMVLDKYLYKDHVSLLREPTAKKIYFKIHPQSSEKDFFQKPCCWLDLLEVETELTEKANINYKS
jgi:hypothetical protein